nr:class I SAM-dependent methyltransferase [Kibdelosporangium sp. MJ126-NF4]CEL22881.1 Protein-N(5)-glutamine methyltransferase PrmC, methylates polypeptide chain release factors RF1 and RF2 [Kibdelosporangium sp. MJ126-NF4]CTQ90021.1 Protein-N(5)-glutamine methyltransferase PrmC, methylates polypeptide chain release factors RF1 and RF2 [Kibdelosporangium sp. MJ126-NF4]
MESIIEVGAELTANHAVKLAKQGRILLWRGDFRNALQLLAAMRRRVGKVRRGASPAETFRHHRAATAHRARLLGQVQVDVGPGYTLDLPHAPDISEACTLAFGAAPSRMPLTDIMGALGAHRWRVRGVHVPALGAKIHPHYGVFAPTRHEYVDLVASTPWPSPTTVFDIGTGTGVLAAVLAQRGADSVVAVDIEPRAVECARDNVDRLGLSSRIHVRQQDLFPDGTADLVVCNPPWLPAAVSSPLDAAVYDPGSRMLRGFLGGLCDHLSADGEAWLVVSDLAERLGLRAATRTLITDAGLVVLDRLDIRPRHRTQHRTTDADPLAEHRAAEITSLWRISR